MTLKKAVIPNIPYIIIGLYASKIGQAWRMSLGADISERLRNIGVGFSQAFESSFPSFHPADLLLGIVFACFFRLAVYLKSKREKKLRRGVEYGSARWSA